VIFDWQSTVLPMPSRIDVGHLLQDLANLPLPARLFLLAISPAVCEELFFRGAVLSGLRRDLSTAGCLAWQAVTFGAAHGSIYRFVPTALVGIVLAALTLRARSVLPAMLLHASYNLLLVLEVDQPMWLWLALPGAALIAWGRRAKIGNA